MSTERWSVIWGLDYDIEPTTAGPSAAYGNFSGESLTLEKLEAMRAEYAAPPPSPEALEQASFLGFFALGVPCCAGSDGLRIRVVALEPVTPLDLGVAKMKLERWYPEVAGVIELAAAGCWRDLVR